MPPLGIKISRDDKKSFSYLHILQKSIKEKKVWLILSKEKKKYICLSNLAKVKKPSEKTIPLPSPKDQNISSLDNY